ncbi:hypothetical protein [Lewinella cohaerens]|uniref:hypothetical protein n=1 Tax=Lewinella cohaerens TaxID=70995 RepID=UPI0003788CB8|nr:hypothetical protein [Lewinella cohaerens]
MSFMISASQMINSNRRLQRKRNVGFRTTGLPLAKTSNEIMEPVSPLVAQRFKAQMESDRKRMEMATGLVLILVLGLSTAALLLMTGFF